MKLNEIKRIPAEDYEGGKSDVMIHHTDKVHVFEKTAKKLPGGSHFTWAYDKVGKDLTIYIFDPKMETSIKDYESDPNVIGRLSLEKGLLGWAVSDVSVFEEYRGQRIGLALYGLALDTLKLRLVSDIHQTPSGQKMWRAITSIPGTKVEVIFSANESIFNPKNLTEKGRKIWDGMKIKKLKDFVEQIGGDYADPETGKYWALPVKVVNGEVQSEYVNVYGSYFGQLIASRS